MPPDVESVEDAVKRTLAEWEAIGIEVTQEQKDRLARLLESVIEAEDE